MRVIFCGQVPKDSSYPEANEDVFEIAENECCLAVSDGASESFDSKTWAQLLVRSFVKNPILNSSSLSDAIVAYNAKYDLSKLSWSKQAAFARGSFATLLGLEVSSSQTVVDLLSVGDSLAVLLCDGKMLESFPYCDSQEFQQRPELFSTKPSNNEFFDHIDFFSRHCKTWNIRDLKNPTVLCMTDALGEWSLKRAEEGEPQWNTLLSIRSSERLRSIVTTERGMRRMRIDDVTLVSIAFDGVELDELSHT